MVKLLKKQRELRIRDRQFKEEHILEGFALLTIINVMI